LKTAARIAGSLAALADRGYYKDEEVLALALQLHF